uniref:AAA+ ATPase domain-containing protein n=1 Tax=Strigamia maritima TaxID=126957 RepID=T1INT9_STRMM
MAGGVHMQPLTRNEVTALVFRLTLLGAVTYFGIKWMMHAIDPTRKQKLEAQKRAERILHRIGVKGVKLSEYELAIAANLVDPASLTVAWDDIAGLESVVQELRESVILPIQKRDLFRGSQLIQPPKGVLLHGPPGCGKTMIAKATAREAGARFVNLELSALTDKWYGESQKLASAVFSLAVKLQPAIVFIDEIDSFLRSRDSHDHEATAMMKAQFMSLWDGLITDPNVMVVVMGATNRPHDVDKAILRRMPCMFHVGLPNVQQRRSIVRLILLNEDVGDDVDLVSVAKWTEGFSGSDLRELCRNAALYRVKEYLNLETSDHDQDKNDCSDATPIPTFRAILMEDFKTALTKMKVSKMETGTLKMERIEFD